MWLLKYLVLPLLTSWLKSETETMKDNADERQAAELAKVEIDADHAKVRQAETKEEALDALNEMLANRARRRGQ